MKQSGAQAVRRAFPPPRWRLHNFRGLPANHPLKRSLHCREGFRLCSLALPRPASWCYRIFRVDGGPIIEALKSHMVFSASGALSVLYAAVRFVFWPLARWFRQRVWVPIVEAFSRVPGRTLIVLAGGLHPGFWGEATAAGDRKGTQVVIDFDLTNITDRPVNVNGAWLMFWRWGLFPTKRGGEFLVRHPQRDEYGGFPVLPRASTRAAGMWFIFPPAVKKQSRWLKVRVSVIDQYGNQHRTARIKLPHAARPRLG